MRLRPPKCNWWASWDYWCPPVRRMALGRRIDTDRPSRWSGQIPERAAEQILKMQFRLVFFKGDWGEGIRHG